MGMLKVSSFGGFGNFVDKSSIVLVAARLKISLSDSTIFILQTFASTPRVKLTFTKPVIFLFLAFIG